MNNLKSMKNCPGDAKKVKLDIGKYKLQKSVP